MCGIAGVYRVKGVDDDTGVVEAMNVRLAVRGPDGGGVVRAGPVTLGNRRLAILDLSDAGDQPMWSADGRCVITFNGETYNFRELVDELGIDRGRLHSRTDTEVVLLAWQRWGPQALSRMVGQWAFAVYDTAEATLWLARDRFGEKPLFFHRTAQTLAFASTIPALLEAPWVPRELDPDALEEYLTLRYVVSPRTILAGVDKLPGGHLLRADRRSMEIHSWYRPQFHARGGAPPETNREELGAELGALLQRASRRCLVSDVPVALFLSDGIDSNSIHACLRESGEELPTISFHPAEMARTNASPVPASWPGSGLHLDLVVANHERVRMMVPAFAALNEPVGDGSALATWMLVRAARERATVFLCGHGGDELLGGYRLSQDRFRLAVLAALARIPGSLTARAIDHFVYGAEGTGAKRARLLGASASEAPAAARFIIHRPLPIEDLGELVGHDGCFPTYLRTIDELYARCGKDAHDLDRIQEVMLATFLSENICSFADSMAMASAAELRMPFLDRDLVEFVLSLPHWARVGRWPGHTNTKLILRWWARRHLPKDITKRKKHPFHAGSIARLLRDYGETIRGYVLDVAPVRRALPGLESWLSRPPDHFLGDRGGTLWAVLALGIWSGAAGIR
ncbi:MAG: asparagine synthase (glutamine-hydrolyzing) [Acidobacteria bacterium]|nr:asparagine synthase (glutamine-hydrolyzing) [Acidobacteriota bacterium]